MSLARMAGIAGILLCASALATTLSCAVNASHAQLALAQPSYEATGTIKSFGPRRAFVNIAHDAIPGYMGAMTMSFEPTDPGQLEPLSLGQRVKFRFTETPDARRILQTIAPLGT